MKTLLLALLGVASLSAQCVLKPNPDTGLLDCTGGPAGPAGPAGAGITTLNTLTALTQTFAVGTAGTDFNISSATSTHTINCPTASSTIRGCISTADWTIFNAKESALTFSAPLSRSTNTISMPAAASGQNGYLTSTDWATFNGKEAHTATLTFLGALGVTDDTIIVNNGTSPQLKTLPSCSDAVASKLLYDSSTNTWSCGTDQSGGSGGGTATARDFTSSQYWLYPYAASPTSSQHGFANCDYSRTITSGDSEAPPYDVHCHSTVGSQTINGQTVGQYDLLVSWVAATAGRVALNLGGGGGGSGTGTVTATAGALTNNAVVLGAGTTDTKALASLGTTTTVLHGNAAGAPTFGAVVNSDITNATIDLTTKVTGLLPSANIATNVPSCSKYTVSRTALTTAATTQDITVVTLPARAKIQGITIEPTTTWAGTSVTALTVSLGVSGTPTAYTSAYTLITGSAGVVPGNTVFQDDGGHFSTTLASHAVLARFTSTGANVNAMTAGDVAFSVCSVILP